MLHDEVEALVLLGMTIVACGIAEAIEVVSGLSVLIDAATNPVEALKMTSFSTRSLVSRSLEKPDATSSSCCTGCLGSDGKKNLFTETSLLLDEVEAIVFLGMTTVACGIAEAIEFVSKLFVLTDAATNPVDALKITSFSKTTLVYGSLEKPDATSSLCCTGCLGCNGKKNLL